MSESMAELKAALAAEREKYQREREIWAAKKKVHTEMVERLRAERDQLRADRNAAYSKLDQLEGSVVVDTGTGPYLAQVGGEPMPAPRPDDEPPRCRRCADMGLVPQGMGADLAATFVPCPECRR